MDQGLRKKILSMAVQARRLLEEDVLSQLEGTYGIAASGKGEPIGSMSALRESPRLADERREIDAAIDHELSAVPNNDRAQALERFVREVAYTYLNRFAAVKMLERRGVIPESVGKGLDSEGFRLFQRVCPEVAGSDHDGGYRRYLAAIFDEVAVSVRILFDGSLPHSIIFPEASTLRSVLRLLNDKDLADVWLEEETIGWIYQYFTPKELRERARKESSAPRNSYELAFRNQFYTPGYVVRFLTDNTLGRLWYELRQGDTRLAEVCTYMVRRPGEILPERKPKDPREVRVLDPACGSGHFLLYAFDLLSIMYEEAGYPKADIPGHILEHNLYGIDIDLRATQIAGFALFLKAMAYDRNELITKGNIVCAEPMPGDRKLFAEFLSGLGSPTLGRIAKEVWDALVLAAEAGSLLRPAEKLTKAIARERRAWASKPQAVHEADLWGTSASVQTDFSDVTEESFWDAAEETLIRSLTTYAEQTQNGAGASRRLFARDGAQGIRFLDLMSKSYDVILMNPPFGSASKGSKAYIDQQYPLTKNDVYAAFVERGLELLRPGGRLGAITSRTGFFLGSFQRWREDILLKKARLTVMADLGAGVLDTAMVETAAYCLEVAG